MEYLRAFWIFLVAAGLVWSVARSFRSPGARSVPGAACRVALLTIVVTQLLALTRSLNGLTFVVCVALWVLFRQFVWVRTASAQVHASVLAAMRAYEEGGVLGRAATRLARFALLRWREFERRSASITAIDLALLVVLAVVIMLAAMARFGPALGQVRFGHPDMYRLLLDARQLILAGTGNVVAAPLANLTAGLAVVAGVDAVHATRFVGAALGFALAFAAAGYLRAATGNRIAVLFGFSAMGLYTFAIPVVAAPIWLHVTTSALDAAATRQWNAGVPELAALFVLCTARTLHSRDWIGAACGALIVAMMAPPFLLVLAAAAVASRVAGLLGAIGAVSTWLVLAGGAAARGDGWHIALTTLPVALALAAALIVHMVGLVVPRRVREPAGFALLVMLLVGAADLVVVRPRGIYMEHEIAARKTAEIAARFARGRWLVIGPVEQFPVVYGVGWHQDLADFVWRHTTAGTAEPSFRFEADEVFIFIEKQPFVVDAPLLDGFHALADPTQRNYRSIAGRASLEYETARLCERAQAPGYVRSVYYEDAVLKIYRYSRDRESRATSLNRRPGTHRAPGV